MFSPMFSHPPRRAAIGGFHDAGTAAACRPRSGRLLGKIDRPFGNAMASSASFIIVAPAGAGLEGPRRAEKHDRILDFFLAEMGKRI